MLNETTKNLIEGLLSTKGKSYKLVNVAVKDTFSMAGSSRCLGGSKVSLSFQNDDGIITVAATVPLKGNNPGILIGESLNDREQLVVDSFYETELWCGALAQKPAMGTLAFQVDLADDKTAFTIGIQTAKGYECTLRGVISASASILMARDLGLGVGMVFDEHVVTSVHQKFVNIENAQPIKKVA